MKYLKNFWRTLERLLINSAIGLILTWSANCVIDNSTGPRTIKTTDTKLYDHVAPSDTKLLGQNMKGIKFPLKIKDYIQLYD